MFGDIGHGFLMMLSALAFIMVEKKYPRGFGEEVRISQRSIWSHMLIRSLLQQITDTFFFGRYIIFLMGIFAMYTGFIYNDIFSLNLPVFASGWRWPSSIEPGQLVEAISTGRTYAFGLDPAWHGADNALIFTNSLKMKMSIIFGVCHVSLDH